MDNISRVPVDVCRYTTPERGSPMVNHRGGGRDRGEYNASGSIGLDDLTCIDEVCTVNTFYSSAPRCFQRSIDGYRRRPAAINIQYARSTDVLRLSQSLCKTRGGISRALAKNPCAHSTTHPGGGYILRQSGDAGRAGELVGKRRDAERCRWRETIASDAAVHARSRRAHRQR